MIDHEREKNPFVIVGMIVLLIVCVFGSAYLDYAWKKAIVRDAIQEAEQAKSKGIK